MEDLIIRENETRQKLVNDINESNLPAFALENMLKDILEQVQREKEKQLQQAYAVAEKRELDKKGKKKEEVKENAKNTI